MESFNSVPPGEDFSHYEKERPDIKIFTDDTDENENPEHDFRRKLNKQYDEIRLEDEDEAGAEETLAPKGSSSEDEEDEEDELIEEGERDDEIPDEEAQMVL
ncbi:MAG: hypothetical protein A2017_16905 [Lentisphaerae bacterium GWF2_44_16]|nr:MAG: hypothetical protein A2017_16905 [Lentisphaerae bacterium GWF2_44_16]HAU66418.1 hypothetical protein [Candidatus Uhrbacteria bacterium]